MMMKRLLAIVVGAWACAAVAADGKAEYDRRNIERYQALFKSLDRDGDGVVARAETQGDLNFSPHFADMDINRDGVVTAAELQRYLEQQHGTNVGMK